MLPLSSAHISVFISEGQWMQIDASLFTSSFCWLPLLCNLTASIIPVHKSSIITQHFHDLHRLLLLFNLPSNNMCTENRYYDPTFYTTSVFWLTATMWVTRMIKRCSNNSAQLVGNCADHFYWTHNSCDTEMRTLDKTISAAGQPDVLYNTSLPTCQYNLCSWNQQWHVCWTLKHILYSVWQRVQDQVVNCHNSDAYMVNHSGFVGKLRQWTLC